MLHTDDVGVVVTNGLYEEDGTYRIDTYALFALSIGLCSLRGLFALSVGYSLSLWAICSLRGLFALSVGLCSLRGLFALSMGFLLSH